MNKTVYILGGGTVFHVTPHLALSAPAYGTTAKRIYELAKAEFETMGVQLHLTKMAGGPNLEINEHIARWVDGVIADPLAKVVFFNPALVDFKGDPWLTEGNELSEMLSTGKYAQRLDSSIDNYAISLSPDSKIVDRIRKERKDITLVAFKTTCGATQSEQYIAGLHLLKRASANLVLANDVKTRVNMVITPEEARYHVTLDRDEALRGLVEMANLRSHLTFTRSTVVAGEAISWKSPLIPQSLREVVNNCVERGAYKPFRGATVGHFAAKVDATTFLTSKRKTNFNDIAKLGLVKIKTDGPDSVIAYGAKPSVGGQSQRIVFDEHPDLDCIVHFHCPIRPGSRVPIVSQREFECGSHECGKNTSRGLQKFVVRDNLYQESHTLWAVYLDQHGPNIVFNRNVPSRVVSQFIEANFDLDSKTGGYVTLPQTQVEQL